MSDSVWPHRQQPTRIPRPQDSPGKNTGVGCHFLLQCMKVKSESEVAQSCLTLRDPMDCSPPSSSVRGILKEDQSQTLSSLIFNCRVLLPPQILITLTIAVFTVPSWVNCFSTNNAMGVIFVMFCTLQYSNPNSFKPYLNPTFSQNTSGHLKSWWSLWPLKSYDSLPVLLIR